MAGDLYRNACKGTGMTCPSYEFIISYSRLIVKPFFEIFAKHSQII